MWSHRRLTAIATGVLLITGACLAQEDEGEIKKKPLVVPPMGVDGSPLSPMDACRYLVGIGEPESALAYCRKAYDMGHATEAAGLLAGCEFAAGDAVRAVALWQAVMDGAGWSFDASNGKANALWRAGQVKEAEELFLANYQRAPGLRTISELIRFYMGFSRWGEAEAWGEEGAKKFPDNCHILDMLSATKAALGNTQGAVVLIKRIKSLPCPPYAWASLPGISDRLDMPAFKALLDPDEIAKSLRPNDIEDTIEKLTLLRFVPAPAVGAPVAKAAVENRDFDVRSLALAILQTMGTTAMEPWNTVLTCDDFVLRKYAIRRQMSMKNPAFLPLLEKVYASEQMPGNRAMLQLLIGDLLVAGKDPAAGETMLKAVPETDPMFALAALQLSAIYEASKDYTQALQWIQLALAKAPDLTVDPARIERLKQLASKQ
jgi:tetratricopeptide (TPR) repeat protein